MFLKYIQIVNFRNHLNSRYEFTKGVNSIIGENDSGKSNGITALRILLDDDYYYNVKRLKESDFSDALGDWRGHWIIISAFFDEISADDQASETCSEIIPENENCDFLKSYIRCKDSSYGTITLFIRPNAKIRRELSEAVSKEDFDSMRTKITLSDYEFYFTARSQADFTEASVYSSIVGDFEAGTYVSPKDDDAAILGGKVDIINIWRHISLVFIDALRDAENELHKPKSPVRRIFDTLKNSIEPEDIQTIKGKIRELNTAIAELNQIKEMGGSLNAKLREIVGLVYSPELEIESRIQEDISSIAKNLMVIPTDTDSIERLGLGHLNILYIALKLIEFEYSRRHEVLNIMVIEEPEAHIHTHIQRTLFDNLQLSKDYTQIIMTTHSTHLSEVSDVNRINVLKVEEGHVVVMRPTTGLDEYGCNILKQKNKVALSKCLERYLDAKRSVLLFSKGVILVEGDGEELLIPTIVHKALGITLDEIGVGLVNVGSVGFDNIASVFSDERIRRKCSIITDLDTYMKGAEKSSEIASKLGANRHKKLEGLYGNHSWVQAFYAQHTFEVDFADLVDNRSFIKAVIDFQYTQGRTIERHKKMLDGNAVERYDQVLTLAKEMGKGWYATVLATHIDNSVVIPEYILNAVVHASFDVIAAPILKKMVAYALKTQEDSEVKESLNTRLLQCRSSEEEKAIISEFCEQYPDSMVARFIKARG